MHLVLHLSRIILVAFYFGSEILVLYHSLLQKEVANDVISSVVVHEEAGLELLNQFVLFDANNNEQLILRSVTLSRNVDSFHLEITEHYFIYLFILYS